MLSQDSCPALVTVMEDDHLAWMREVFVGEFLDEMDSKVLAELDVLLDRQHSLSQHGLRSLIVLCQSCLWSSQKWTLNMLKSLVKELLWMFPVTAWQHGQVPGTSHIQ